MSTSKIWYCVNCGYEVEHRGRCHRCKARLISSPLVQLAGLDEDDEVAYRLGSWSEQARGRLIVALIRANVEHRFDDEELVVAAEDEDKVDDLLAELQDVLATEGIEVLVEYDDDEELDEEDEEDEDDGDGYVDTAHVHDDSGEEGDQEVEDAAVDANAASEVDQQPEVGDWAPGSASIPSEEELEELALDPIQASIALLYDAAKRLRTDPTDMQADGDVAEASAGVFADDDVVGVDADTWAAIGRVTRRLLGALGAEEALEDEIRTQAGVLTKLLHPYVELDIEELEADGTTTAELLAESTAALPHGRFDHGRSDDDEVEMPVEGETTDDEDEDDEDEDDEAEDDEDQAGGTEVSDDGVSDGGVAVGDDDAEIVYELPEWLPEQRANLSILLEEEGIEHTWDGGDLVIGGGVEAAVDAIFDRIEDQEPVADGEERYRAIEELFASADRLAGDPDSPARRDDYLAASAATDGPSPVGMPDSLWWQIRARARTLTDDLHTGAASSRIREDAAALRDLLRSVV
jgi:hypothetical protein